MSGRTRTPTGLKKQRRTDIQPHKWTIGANGAVVDFSLKLLREDLILRMRGGFPLYTLEECKVLLRETTRVAVRWQETELPNLMYLAQLHQRAFPGRPIRYQWPPSALPSVPFDFGLESALDNPSYKLSKIVEELNKSMLRMIDILFNERRERLLFAGRIIEDLEAIPELK